ncbi:hypothetical protein C8R47DRAFT_1192285 [Mycena vitilis]|nr:hypothetical protein C8R47DRAFT_1192285 [Mycena vitilis]
MSKIHTLGPDMICMEWSTSGRGPCSTVTGRPVRRAPAEPEPVCCDFVALEPFLEQRAGELRTVEAPQSDIIPGPGQVEGFCANCQVLAQEAVDDLFGLRIRDAAGGGRIYQSAATAKAAARAGIHG